ncbi:MAG: hypothetical protein E6K76_06870 [Candidatus Eisenbacteria bacterium]|uniref:Tetratricopeptide repeat protein n=1 Tax=Eiseniibacteriota bacterium TaxID=2212470 RepID=A0A538T524_UNCEI|nr:MAG: hypothetical protein E6K76_06870 [Candidatus Eisenbacteria bacterium]
MTRADADRLLALGRQAKLTGEDADGWAKRLDPERSALREAVEWLAANGEVDAGVELAAAVWRLWHRSGAIAEGRALLAAALDRPGAPTAARSRALYADGLLAFRAGDQARSQARNEEALRVAREIGDPESEALALVGLSRVALRAGEYDSVCRLAEEALRVTRDLERDAQVMPLHLLAAGTRLSGDYPRATTLYKDSLTLNRGLRDLGMVRTELHNLGHVSLHLGDVAAAVQYFGECSELRRGSENPYDRAMELLNGAALAYHRGETERTADRVAEVESTLNRAGIVLDPDDRFEVDWLREQLAAK